MTGVTVELLPLGRLRGEEGNFFRAAGRATASEPVPVPKWRELVLYATVIEVPGVGPVLYETSGSPEPDAEWTGGFVEAFPYEIGPEDRLDRALERTGRVLSDVVGVIVGHLHPDHAGGLALFRGTDVPIYVHELELKHAFYATATGEDLSFDFPYLDVRLNWVPIHGERTRLFPGVELIHLPGHTPGLQGALVDLEDSGPVLFASDHLIFREHLEGREQGWVADSHSDWHRSLRTVQRLIAETGAQVAFGHDPAVYETFAPSPAVHR